MIISLLQVMTYQLPQGLPGYNGIFFPAGRQTSDVYDWVQRHLDHATLYSVGLRPYGLYGEPYHNQVVSFRLESEGWTLQEGLQVIRQEQPQYLAISLDPFTRKAPPDIFEMAKHPEVFQIVYHDPLAVVFRITDRVKSLSISP